MPAVDPIIPEMLAAGRAHTAHLRATTTPIAGLVPDGRGGWFKPVIPDLHRLVTSINAEFRAGIVRVGGAIQRRAWKRTDVWVKAFGGAYRLALPPAQMEELERKCGRGIVAIVARVTRPLAAGAASRNECIETLRLALVGGGVAIVNGAEKRIGPREAAEIIDGPVENMPLEEVRKLAAEALSVRMDGRESTPAEFAAVAATDTPPAFVAPEWARAAA